MPHSAPQVFLPYQNTCLTGAPLQNKKLLAQHRILPHVSVKKIAGPIEQERAHNLACGKYKGFSSFNITTAHVIADRVSEDLFFTIVKLAAEICLTKQQTNPS